MTSSKTYLAEPRPMLEPSAVGDVDTAPLARLRSLAQVQRLRRRQKVSLLGHDTVYVVRTGLIAVEATPLAGTRTILDLLYPGDIVVPSVLAPVPELSLTTATQAEIWRIPSTTFTQELSRDPQFCDYVFQRLNMQRARSHLHVAVLAGLSSEQRVAALLIEASCRLGYNDGTAISFDMPLSRTEVAEYLSLNADTLSRIMSRLTNSRVLDRSGRAQMTVRDFSALCALCPLADAVMTLHKVH